MSDAVQLGLFGEAQTDMDGETQVEWSYSRRQTLEQCTRRYYFDYYGAKARLASADPQKKDIRFLSTLSNCYLRSGVILHSAIRSFYKYGDSSGKWLVSWAQRLYRTDHDYSCSGTGIPTAGQRYSPAVLLEFHYRMPDAEARYTESEERLARNLGNFLTSPAYAAMRCPEQRASAKVEERISLKTPMFGARGKVDLALRQSGKLAIVDWKTGEAEESTESLQLAFYALWAAETEGCCLEDISLYRGQLTDGSLRPVALDDHILLRVRARIIQDLERMRVLDRYGRDAVAEVFPPCSFPRVCKLCPYQGICVAPLRRS